MTQKEAMKILKDFHDKSALFSVRTALDTIIPELKESEDEKIRKDIVETIKIEAKEFSSSVIASKAELWLAWLEKQGEQKEKQYITITQKILDYTSKYESSFENGIPKLGDSWKVIKISKYPGVNGGKPVVKVVNEDNGDWMRLPLNIVDIKIEHNPADNVKPKFKVGDWCIDNEDNTIFQITKVLSNLYYYRTNESKEYSCTRDSIERDAHLWTIQDAKDGDVLFVKPTENLGEQLIIFGGITSDSRIGYYCRFLNNKFSINGGLMGYDHEYFLPATKEQRDFLFSKMIKAGYEWDAEKKELKKIEQKSWNEEDEVGLGDAMWAIEQARGIAKDENDMGNLWYAERWLKSLKERMKGE